MRRVSAIVPAAGHSTRFGGPNKLLQPWAGSTLIGSVVKSLLAARLSVTVVTGRDAVLVEREAAGAMCVFNPEWEASGLGDSIAFGIRATGEAEGYLIALGDMPGVRVGVLQRMFATFEKEEAGAIVAPVYEKEPDRPGHPVLFDSAHRHALLQLTGDEGARTIIQANRHSLRLVLVNGSLEDIDQPEDLVK